MIFLVKSCNLCSFSNRKINFQSPAIYGRTGLAGATFPVGTVDQRAKRLIATAQACVAEGVAACGPGAAMGDVGKAISETCRQNGFVPNQYFLGQGIGDSLRCKVSHATSLTSTATDQDASLSH